MIKENENYISFQKRNLRKQRSIMIRPVIAKHGIMTKYGLKQFQDRMIMEGNHNLMFGTVDGTPVGLCLQDEFTCRSLNTFVLEGDTHKGWGNYTLPNLLAWHSSSVVVGSEEDLEAVAPTLLKNGMNLYLMQFEGDTINRFCAFPHKEWQLNSMAESCVTLFHEARDEATKAYFGDKRSFAEGIYSSFLKLALLYTGLSEAITDHERTFKTAGNVLKDIQENGVKQIAKYTVHESEFVMAQIKDATECSWLADRVERMVERMLTALLYDLTPLMQCQTFEKHEIPQMNVSIDKFVNEKCCMLIPIPKEEKAKKLVGFYLFMFLRELYAYGEENWAYSGMGRDQALKNPVCFYLNEFAAYKIPNFLNYLATCRRYGIGFSVIAHSVQEIRLLYPIDDKGFDDAECLLANVDTVLVFAAKGNDDYNYLNKMMPVPVDTNGKEISVRKKPVERYAPYRQIVPAYSSEELHQLLSEKAIVIVRDFYPIVCDTLSLEIHVKGEI